MSRRVTWREDEAGPRKRLDAALSERAGWLSRSAIQHSIRNGAVRVNGEVETRPSHRLGKDDEVEAFLPEPDTDLVHPAPVEMQLQIAYQDEHVLVIDKPCGVPVHPGPGHSTDTLVNGLLFHFPQIAEVGEPDRPGVVHRLDMDTSGLLVFALTTEAYTRLGRAMRAREIKRTYTALVAGQVQPAEGTIDAPIGRDPSNRTRQAIVESGKPARTRYKTVEQLENATLLELELETGRMHQIRVHLAAVGFPIFGDPTYGKRAAVPGLERQFLHASGLRFEHPETGEQIVVSSPLPPDLATVLSTMRGP